MGGYASLKSGASAPLLTPGRTRIGKEAALKGTPLDPDNKTKNSVAEGRSIQGLTTPDGQVYVVASNISKGNEGGVLLHEAFHSAMRNAVGEKRWNALMDRMAVLASNPNTSQWVKQAKARAEDAGVRDGDMAEEVASYAIEEYENAPASIRKWVDDILASIRMALASMAKALGHDAAWAKAMSDPAALRKLAISALKASAREAQKQAGSRVDIQSKDKTGRSMTDKVLAALRGLQPKGKGEPRTRIIIPETEDAYVEAARSYGQEVGKGSWGFYDFSSRTIVLNPEGKDLSQNMFHEAAHPVISALMHADHERFAAFADDIIDEQGGKYDKWAKENYADKDDLARAIEAIAEYMGDVADGRVKVSTDPNSAWQKVKAWIQKLLADLGWDTRRIDLSKPQNVRDFAAAFAVAMNEGIRIAGLKDVSREVGDQQSLMEKRGKSADSKALRDRIRQVAREAREARKEFAASIRDMLADLKGKVNPAQVKAITAAAARVDPTRPKQVERFARQAERMMERVEHAQELSDAKKVRKRAKAVAKRKTLPVDRRDLLRSAAMVNPSNIDDPGAYASMVDAFIKGATDPTTPLDEQVSNADMEKAIEGWIDEQAQNLREEDAAVALLANPAGQQAIENAKAVLAAEDPADAMGKVPDNEKEDTTSALRDIAKERVGQVSAMDIDDLLTGDDILDASIKSLLKGIRAINDRTVDLMSGYQAAIYIHAANNILVNGSEAGIAPAIAMGHALNALGGTPQQVAALPAASVPTPPVVAPPTTPAPPKPTRNALQIVADMGGKARSWFSPAMAMATTSVSDAYKFYLGLKNELGEMQRLIGVGEYIRGKQKWNREREKINKEAADFYRALRRKYGARADSAQSMAAEGMMAFLIQQMPGKSEQEAFDLRKKMVLEDIKAKLDTRRDKKQAVVGQKVYDRVIATANSRAEALDNLKRSYPAAHESLGFLVSMFKPYANMVRAHLFTVWNKSDWTNDPLYLPILTVRSANSSKGIDPMGAPSFMGQSTLTPAQPRTSSARKRYETLGGRSISYNVRGGAITRLSENLYDVHTTLPRMRIAEFFRATDAPAVFRSKENHKFMEERMVQWLDAQQYDVSNDWADKIVGAIAHQVRKRVSVLALGGLFQLPKQYSEAMASASVMLGPKYVLGNVRIHPDANTLLDQYAIGSRHSAIKGGTRFRRRMEELDNELMLALRSGVKDRIQAANEKINDFWMASLSKGDIWSAKTAWLAAYEKRREEQGHAVTSWSDEAAQQETDHEREEAALYAEAIVDTLYVSSDPAKAASLTSMSTGEHSAWKNAGKMLAFPFSTFTMQAVSRTYLDASDLLFGPRNRKRAALVGLASRLSGALTFSTMAIGTSKILVPVVGGLMASLAKAYGDDEEEDKEVMVAFTSAMALLHAMGLMDADLTRAAKAGQNELIRGPKDLDPAKTGRLLYTRAMMDFLGAGLFPGGDAALVETANYMQYLMLLNESDPSVFNRDGTPMKFNSWQKLQQSWLITPGQGWPGGAPGMLGVLDREWKDLGRQRDYLLGEYPKGNKVETPQMKAAHEAVKQRNMKVKELVDRYDTNMGVVEKKAWIAETDAELRKMAKDEDDLNGLVGRVNEAVRRKDMDPDMLKIYNMRSSAEKAVAIVDMLEAAETKDELRALVDRLNKAGFITEDIQKEVSLEEFRRKAKREEVK